MKSSELGRDEKVTTRFIGKLMNQTRERLGKISEYKQIYTYRSIKSKQNKTKVHLPSKFVRCHKMDLMYMVSKKEKILVNPIKL